MSSPKARVAHIERKTQETTIDLRLNLDGRGRSKIRTGIPFMDHMLKLLSKHSLFDITLQAQGDTEVDDHHLVEDLGLAFGQALRLALGNKKGIVRYGNFLLPMDEALSYVAVDLSGRFAFVYKVRWPHTRLGRFDGLLIEHFFESLASEARINLHMALQHGKHPHHIAESLFKGLARALAAAVRVDPRVRGVPSTKGRL